MWMCELQSTRQLLWPIHVVAYTHSTASRRGEQRDRWDGTFDIHDVRSMHGRERAYAQRSCSQQHCSDRYYEKK